METDRARVDGRWRSWLRVSRANFLPVSLLPFCLGTAWAFSRGYRDPLLFLVGLAGAGVVHLAANLFNEYWDFIYRADRSAPDRSPHYGGSGAIQEGAVSPRSVLTAAWLLLAVALGAGAVLALREDNILILVLVWAGAAIAWAYTAPPLRLVYRGWGEAALWLSFGPLLTGGGYLLPAGSLSGPALLLSLGPGFVIAALLTANEFGDAAADHRAGKRNLVVRVGRSRALVLVKVFLLLAYSVIPVGLLTGIFPPLSLLVFCSLPLAWAMAAALERGLRAAGSFAASSRLMILTYNLYHLFLIAGVILS